MTSYYCGRCGHAGVHHAAQPCRTCGIRYWMVDAGEVTAIGFPDSGLLRALQELRGVTDATQVLQAQVRDPFSPDGSPVALARTILYTWPKDDPARHLSGANLLRMMSAAGPMQGMLGAVTFPLGPLGLTVGGGQFGQKASQTTLTPVDSGVLVISRHRCAYVGRQQRLDFLFTHVAAFQVTQVAAQVSRVNIHLVTDPAPVGFDVVTDPRTPGAAFYLEWGLAQAHDRTADLEARLEGQLAGLHEANADIRSRYLATTTALSRGDW